MNQPALRVELSIAETLASSCAMCRVSASETGAGFRSATCRMSGMSDGIKYRQRVCEVSPHVQLHVQELLA